MTQFMVHPTPRGDRKLSEVARHLVIPEGIVTTGWPQVERQLKKMRTPLDTWQQGLLTTILAKRASGKYACGIGGAVISIPRQVGKTHTIGALVFALCTANKDILVLWSAQRVKTHTETFRSMGSMAERKEIAPFVKRVLTGAGTEAVEFVNGSRIVFGSRDNGFGRGIPAVDIVVLDEAQILTESAMEDMVPATNASPNGLVLLMGTPPRPRDPGEVFLNRRTDALAGDTDTLYVELSADPGANPDDRKQWAIANPSYPHRTTEEAILRMRKLLGSTESFLREGLGIWDEAALTKKAINAKAWDALALPADKVPTDGRRVYAVRFAVDGSSVALAAAIRPEIGPIHVEGIRLASMGDGTQWLVAWLVERHEKAAQIVVDGKAGVGYLVNALHEARVPKSVIITAGTDTITSGTSMVEAAIGSKGLTHRGQEELDEQVKAAEKRKIGTNGGFGWAAPDGGNVALLDAVTLAYWGAKTTKRRPGRKAGFL
jgi:phage terminase large subunit-like protein